MRLSQLFFQTLREDPVEAEVASHRLLLRAGYIRQAGTGIFSYLHLAQRSLTKIMNILRQEMDAIGGQEISMPVVHPAELWKATGRWYQIGTEMGRFADKNKHEMALAMTHEEVVVELARTGIQSYKQLPRLVYQIQTKWRDDPRPRAGLIRAREFTMKDSYSLDADWEGLDKQYRAHYQAYFNIFHRCGLSVVAVKSDVGMMGGKLAHEFMYLTPIGEDTLILCDACGATANRQVASFRKPQVAAEALLPLTKVATPGLTSIQGLAEFLHIPAAKTAKAVFMIATVSEKQKDVEKFVFAVVRGDMEVNETKLANAVQAKELRLAVDEEIRAVNAVPGYASPIGIKKQGVVVVVDDLIPVSPNLTAGANEEGFHLMNTNYPRDYTADVVTDIAVAEDGFNCLNCGSPVRAVRGVEVGNIFKLGTRYSDAVKAVFWDRDGKTKSIIMGCYGIGVGRLLACAAEAHHDDKGLCLPITIAPYQVHLVSMRGAEVEADALYAALENAGVEVLFDDRDERPGVKFNDADLIGAPLRLTVGERSLKAGGVEFTFRSGPDEKVVYPLGQVLEQVKAELQRLTVEINSQVVEERYRD